MAAKLPGVAPTNHFFYFAKLYWHRLERPNNNHLIIGATGKKLTVRRESHAVHGFLVSSRQIIQIRWLGFEITIRCASYLFACGTTVYFLLIRASLRLFGPIVARFFKLPKLDTRILEGYIASCDKISTIRIDIHRH